MADSTINGLTALAAASVTAGSDTAPVWQASAATTKKVTIADLVTAGNTFGTIAANAPATISQTWNNAAVTFTGKLISITDTASNGASLLQDWQVGGVKKASITKGGAFYSWNTYTDASNYERGVFDWTTTANTLTIGSKAAGTGTQRNVNYDAAGHVFYVGGSAAAFIQSTGPTPTADGAQSLGQNTTYRWNNVYAKSTVAVTGASSRFIAYNLDPGTSGGNNEYAVMDWLTAANVFTIGTFKSGTGASRAVNFVAGGVTALTLGTAGDVQLPKTITAAGTTGAQTINKASGSVNFAAAATSLVVTNSLVTTSSVIIATVGTNDTTMKTVSAVASAGSFTLFANAAATAETRVNFIITN